MHLTHVAVALAAIHVVQALLADDAKPCRVVRRNGRSLLMVDPASSKMDVLEFCVDHLTDAENNALRLAYGQPRIGWSMSNQITEGTVGPESDIPAKLRLPMAKPMAWLASDHMSARARRFSRTDVWEELA